MNNKILSLKDLNNKHVKNPIIIGGCFDLIHIGHILFLKSAKNKKGSLVILLESDEFITHNKKRLPFHKQIQRAEILASLIYVDYVVLIPKIFKTQDYERILRKINPKLILAYENDEKIKNKIALAKKLSIKFEILKLKTSKYSSSYFLDLLKK